MNNSRGPDNSPSQRGVSSNGQDELGQASTRDLSGFRDGTLSRDDLLFLQERGMALRHVSTKERMERESRNGVQRGDAVSLAFPEKFLTDEDLPHAYKANMKGVCRTFSSLTEDQNLPVVPLSMIPKEALPAVELRFSDAIRKFIKTSIKWDAPMALESATSISEMVQMLEAACGGFLLGAFQHAEHPDDFRNYPLGKCGVQYVAADKMVGSFSLEGLYNNYFLFSAGGVRAFRELLASNRSEDEVANARCYEMIVDMGVDYVWSKFVSLVRSTREGGVA